MKIRREFIFIAGILLLLFIVTAAAGLFQGKDEGLPPLSSNSNTPEGARALRLWLSAAGYEVSNQSTNVFAVPDGVSFVLILEPDFITGITAAEWETLDQWIEDGGTLFLASREIWRILSNSPLQVDTAPTSSTGAPIFPVAPIFRAPPMDQPAQLTLSYILKPKNEPGQPLLATDKGEVALRFDRGKGSVILISASSFLTNQGLKDPGNAALTLNLFSLIPKGSRAWIDEWHHGERGSAQELAYGPAAWLTGTPAGFAVLFSAGVIFVSLLLAGRPFGRPVPLPKEQVRRNSLEYVTALANLNRRAGHRRALMAYYQTTLKRAFGRRYRLDPGLPDDEFVERLTRFNPSIDRSSLLGLLRQLDQNKFTETQVVQLAHEAADWLSKLERY